MREYIMILVYTPNISQNEVENNVKNFIIPIFSKNGINSIDHRYCGNKLFAFVMKKHKYGHYVSLSIKINDKNQHTLLTKINKKIRESKDILINMILKVKNSNDIIDNLSKIDINIDSSSLSF